MQSALLLNVTFQAKIVLIVAFANNWGSDIGFCRDEAGKPVIPMGVPIASRGTSTCCRQPATSWVNYTTSCNTHSSAPEDGQINCPKHVEMIGVINKPLMLHLVGCLYYLYLIIFF